MNVFSKYIDISDFIFPYHNEIYYLHDYRGRGHHSHSLENKFS